MADARPKRARAPPKNFVAVPASQSQASPKAERGGIKGSAVPRGKRPAQKLPTGDEPAKSKPRVGPKPQPAPQGGAAVNGLDNDCTAAALEERVQFAPDSPTAAAYRDTMGSPGGAAASTLGVAALQEVTSSDKPPSGAKVPQSTTLSTLGGAGGFGGRCRDAQRAHGQWLGTNRGGEWQGQGRQSSGWVRYGTRPPPPLPPSRSFPPCPPSRLAALSRASHCLHCWLMDPGRCFDQAKTLTVRASR